MAEPVAVYGAVIGTLAAAGAIWNIFEWWAAGRARLKVIASAGELQPAEGQFMVLRGPKFGQRWLLIDVINVSRRPITVECVGFLDHGSGERFGIVPDPGVLPKKLEPGQKVTVPSETQQWKDKLSCRTKLVPFCVDAEGRMHKGKPDSQFRALVDKVAGLEAGANGR